MNKIALRFRDMICCISILAHLPSCSGADQPYSFYVNVVDESGKAVKGARVEHAFHSKLIPIEQQVSVQMTDNNGLCHFTGRANDQGHVTITKEGYYTTIDKPSIYIQQKYSPPSSNVYDTETYGDWEPMDKVIKLVLKPKVKPVPMYFKNESKRIPESAIGAELGYDFEVGDLVAPHGSGKIRDLVFTPQISGEKPDDTRWIFHVKFSNRGDGIQQIRSQVGYDSPRYRGSELRSPTTAPLDGYLPEFQWESNTDPESTDSKDYIYLFRVRTVLDEHGSVVSALYGKMYRQPALGRVFEFIDLKMEKVGDGFGFSYHLNPDGTRNLEFAPEKNLFNNLPRERLVGIAP